MAKYAINKKRTVTNWPWKIPMPTANGGVDKFRAGLDLELPSKSEYRAAAKRMQEEANGDVIKADDLLTEWMIQHVKGWHGFVLEEGDKEEAEFSEASLRQVLDGLNTAGSFHESFNAAVEGRKVKN